MSLPNQFDDPVPSIPGYTNEFLRIAEYVEKTGEYLLNSENVWKKLGIPQDPLNYEYKQIRSIMPVGPGYCHPKTTNQERVLALLFLHSIILSGDTLV